MNPMSAAIRIPKRNRWKNPLSADPAATRRVLPGARSAVLVTHLNETGGELFGDMTLGAVAAHFDAAYGSDRPWDAGIIIGESSRAG